MSVIKLPKGDGTWETLKLPAQVNVVGSEINTFTDFNMGFDATILWRRVGSPFTNKPSDMTQSSGYIPVYMPYEGVSNTGIQVVYGTVGTDIGKIWIRRCDDGIWGVWALVTDQINITSNLVASYTFTSPGKTVTFNNLDINSDGGIYDVVVIGAGLTASDSNPGPLKVYYNNDTNDANYMYRRIYAKADNTLTTSGGNGADGGYIYRLTTFNNIAIVLSGGYPTLNCANTIVNSAGNVEALNYMQYCTDAKTNITSLTFSTTNDMGVGTTIKIYKR